MRLKDPMTIPELMPVAPTEATGRFDIGDTDDMLDRMMLLFARHGDTYRVIAPGHSTPLLMIHAAEDIRRVLATNRGNYVKGLGFDRVRILLGDGLITSDGEQWARQRAMMQPMFHRRVMVHLASSIAASNDALLAHWEASADRGLPVNVTEGMSTMTLEIVLRSIFGARPALRLPIPFTDPTRRRTDRAPSPRGR
jgi:cytochrome P450